MYIRILGRSDCCSERLNPFSVSVDGTTCASDQTIGSGWTTVACRGVGSVLRVFLPGGRRTLTICGLQVLGARGVIAASPPPPSPPQAPIIYDPNNLGRECFRSCHRQDGACPGFCGAQGACCRRGWAGSTEECGSGALGCGGKHCCTAIRSPPSAPPSPPPPPRCEEFCSGERAMNVRGRASNARPSHSSRLHTDRIMAAV